MGNYTPEFIEALKKFRWENLKAGWDIGIDKEIVDKFSAEWELKLKALFKEHGVEW